MFDTDICIFLIKRKSEKILKRLEMCVFGDVGISTITLAELRFGVEKSAHAAENKAALEEFLIPLEVADFDDRAASAYGKVRLALESWGNSIGASARVP